jgi:hypothetical protein
VRYFIRKRSRRTSKTPYTGPCCAIAGVPSGMWYSSLELAESHALKLSEVNPVKFEVVMEINSTAPMEYLEYLEKAVDNISNEDLVRAFNILDKSSTEKQR